MLTNTSTPCIFLKRGILTHWSNPLKEGQLSEGTLLCALTQISHGDTSGSGNVTHGGSINITTLIMLSNVTFPIPASNTANFTKRRYFPHCAPDQEFPPPFTPCQSPLHAGKKLISGFEFSPPLRSSQLTGVSSLANLTSAKIKRDAWPWYQWVLSNTKGAFTSLAPFSMLQGEYHQISNISATQTNGSLTIRKQYNQVTNHTMAPVPVCVKAPFFFILNNKTNTSHLACNSSDSDCQLVECWAGHSRIALVVCIPTYVPIPVEDDPEDFPILHLLRQKRDFGITAAIITAITISAVAATTAAIAMTQQVQTANTINNIVEQRPPLSLPNRRPTPTWCLDSCWSIKGLIYFKINWRICLISSKCPVSPLRKICV